MRNWLVLGMVALTLAMTACEGPAVNDGVQTNSLRAGTPSTPIDAPLEPSDEPTSEPSADPSPEPSVEPSASPTPSPSPTMDPSPVPSASPSPSPTPTLNQAPVWDTPADKYLSYDREVIIELGRGYDPDGDAFTYVFERQYWCTFGKAWTQTWADSIYNNMLRVTIPAGKDDFNSHFYLVSVTDSHGAKSYRMIQVGWGGVGSWSPVYLTDSGASFNDANLCEGATVYHN